MVSNTPNTYENRPIDPFDKASLTGYVSSTAKLKATGIIGTIKKPARPMFMQP